MKRGKLLAALCLILALTGCGTVSVTDESPSKSSASVQRQEQTPAPDSITQENGQLALPEDLPAVLAAPEDIGGEGAYLLLGELPEEDIALYCDNSSQRQQVYLRCGEHFQAFTENPWPDPTILPELTWTDWDGDGTPDLLVRYLRHEGTYFDGESLSPGLVCQEVVYQWDGQQWNDIHFYSGGVCQSA